MAISKHSDKVSPPSQVLRHKSTDFNFFLLILENLICLQRGTLTSKEESDEEDEEDIDFDDEDFEGDNLNSKIIYFLRFKLMATFLFYTRQNTFFTILL